MRKQNLKRNCHSASFRVTDFEITEKQMTDCVSLKYPKNSQQKRWKFPFSTTPLSFDTPSQGTYANPHNPYTARNWSHWPTFLQLITWVYLHSIVFVYLRSNFCVGLQSTHQSLVINSNFGPTLHRFWDTATFMTRQKSNPLEKIWYLGNCSRFFHQIYSVYRWGFRPHILEILLK